MEETQTLRQPLPESESGVDMPWLSPLYAASDLLSAPLIHQTQVEISGHRAWEAQTEGAAPPPQPRIRRYSARHGCI